ncbi:MAG: ribonuclease HIII [Planctomycetes bacterium]|nr:ribonuclease HIII [Planctomycetota bacterium]
MTLTLTPQEIEELRARLERRGFEFRPLQHAHFQARGPGAIVNAYRSGKVVVQGALAAEILGEVPAPKLEGAVVGSDESGKGDYFGPLTVAAVVVRPGQEREVRDAGIRDSKEMSDASILRAAVAVRKLPHAVRVLTPPEYNARHDAEKNVALFLATLHAETVAEALRGASATRVVIDQFTFADRLEEALQRAGVRLPVEIRPRAEDNPAVAAASVLARAEFLLGLRELGNEHGVELPKGAGPPVEAVARRLYQEGGRGALEAVAKIHFKTTLKVTRNLF